MKAGISSTTRSFPLRNKAKVIPKESRAKTQPHRHAEQKENFLFAAERKKNYGDWHKKTQKLTILQQQNEPVK